MQPNSEGSMINRVLRVSPDQSEVFKRNKSRIFFGIDGESMIDTILAQKHRPIEDYIDVAHRAIAMAGLGEDYGEIRVVETNALSSFGVSYLMTTDWLKDDNQDVFDLFVSLDPDYEMSGEPGVTILPTTQFDDGIEGENPLILTCSIEDLFGYDDDAEEQGRPGHAMSPGQNQDRSSTAQTDQNQTAQAGGSGNGSHSDMSSNSGEIADRRSTDTGGNVPAGRGDDQDRQEGGQGRVKSDDDGRLKENRDQGLHKDGTREPSGEGREVGGQGRVTSADDGRLKANIDAGIKKGDGENQSTQQQETREPVTARRSTNEGTEQPKRGRVTSPHDRRLRRNRSK